MLKSSLLTVLLILAPWSLAASDSGAPPFVFPGTGYDPSVPAPSDVLGYELGTVFTPHHWVVEYLDRVAAASDRVLLFRYGRSYEGRDLVYVVVSSEKNIENIEKLRKGNLELADPRLEVPSGFYDVAPVFVWLSYNIHGNEASSTETALAVVYHLAAERSASIDSLLSGVVIIVDPLLNPDGRERYISFYASRMGSKPDPEEESWEHNEPWPGGRFNHYLFDLNRDWSWLTQDESRYRARAYMKWLPQVHCDFHEMSAGSSYFFFPPAEPVHPNYPLEMVSKWSEIFGKANAAAFDERGWPYFVGELFDMFYPGYGDSWPTYHGAVGMTYEQAGHSRGGLVLERKDGTLLTLADRMAHHFVTSLTTIRTAARYRAERLRDFRKFFEDGMHGAKRSGVKEYIIPAGEAPHRSAGLVARLMEQGVEVYRAVERFRGSGLKDSEGRKVPDRRFAAGTYVIPAAQPLGRFLETVLLPGSDLPDTSFYDITAWALPLAFDVDVYSSRSSSRVQKKLLRDPPRPEGGLAGGDPRYGYLVPWDDNGAPAMLASLLEKGCYVRFAMEGFTLGGRDFPAGTLIVPRGENADTLAGVVSNLARRLGVEVFAAPTSYTEKGIDLGSGKTRYVGPARIAVVAGEGVSPSSFGSIWFLMDRIYPVDYSVLDLSRLGMIDLSEFDVIVFPDDPARDPEKSSYDGKTDSSTVAALKSWVRGGGVFIGIGGGAIFASEEHAGLSSVRLKKREKGEQEDPKEKLLTMKEKEKRKNREKIPGTIFRVRLDNTHPIAFGYGDYVKILKTSTAAFETSDKVNIVAYFPEKSRVSGFVSPENEEFLALSPFIVEEKVGKGHVVLFLEDPNFRSFWYGLHRLFMSSVYFVRGF